MVDNAHIGRYSIREDDKEKHRTRQVTKSMIETNDRQRVGVPWGDTHEREPRQKMMVQTQNNKYKHNPR